MRKPAFRLFMILLTCLAAGCGSSLVVAKGRITKGGRPFGETNVSGILSVTFTPVMEGGGPAEVSYPANAHQKQGTFEVRGPDRKGIPPGKYRISVELLKAPGADTLKGKFGPGKSPIVREVSGELIEIDLDKPEG